MTEVLDQGQTTTVPATKPVDLAFEGNPVRYLEIDGKVSQEICTVIDTGLRNNKVVLEPVGTNRRITVNRRRLLPPTADATATVVESGDRYKVLCPSCGRSIKFLDGATEAECPDHGQFSLHWLGVRPMDVDQNATGTKTPKAPKEPKPAKVKAEPTAKEPKQPKAKEAAVTKPRATKELQKVDITTIAGLGELYTKGRVKFDHAHVNVEAHTLLVGDRKHCFNTYNGSLGKKADPIDPAFLQDPTKGFPVKDLAKERATLEKNGYVLVPAGTAATEQTKPSVNGTVAHEEPEAEPEVEQEQEVVSVSGAAALED